MGNYQDIIATIISQKLIPNMYLNNKDLYVELIISKAQGKLTSKAAIMLEILAKETIKKMRYYNNDDKLDCFQSGLLDMFSSWYNFDPDITTNSFSYMTEIFKRGTAKAFNTLYKKKGDPDYSIKVLSIEGSNEGHGMHSI